MAQVIGAQHGLFDATRLVERRLASGITVRLRLAPHDDGRVTVLEYQRRAHDTARWERRPGEEGRTYPFHALGIDLSFESVFG